jgi:hypothetical protein
MRIENRAYHSTTRRMKMKSPIKTLALALLFSAQLIAGSAFAQNGTKPEPLAIQDQGSFAVGGTVVRTPGTYDNDKPTAAGQSLHGDHLYAFYQVPRSPKALPIVMLHGAFQSA